MSQRAVTCLTTVEDHTQKGDHANLAAQRELQRDLKYRTIKAQYIFCCRWGDKSGC